MLQVPETSPYGAGPLISQLRLEQQAVSGTGAPGLCGSTILPTTTARPLTTPTLSLPPRALTLGEPEGARGAVQGDQRHGLHSLGQGGGRVPGLGSAHASFGSFGTFHGVADIGPACGAEAGHEAPSFGELGANFADQGALPRPAAAETHSFQDAWLPGQPHAVPGTGGAGPKASCGAWFTGPSGQERLGS